MTCEPVRLGVVGLGRAFTLMVPSFRAEKRVQLVAATAPRAESRAAFKQAFGGRAYDNVQTLCDDPEVEAIYIATPHQMHADHVKIAARAGKHILVDKPLAVTMEDATVMVGAAEAAGVHLIVGPSHSFDAPVALARQLIESGEYGHLRMIQAFNYTDFLYRPRRPEELRTEAGGGVLFSQAIHQVDVVRLLAGGAGRQVMGMTGSWDADRPTEGAYSALLSFASGAFATLTYSGYAHFDSDIWMDDIGELGHPKDPANYGRARRALAGLNPQAEANLKQTRGFTGADDGAQARHHEHFGPVIALCDHADLRLTPSGVEVFADRQRHFIKAPMGATPRQPVLEALVQAVRHGIAPAQTARWGRASLEICRAILQSAQSQQPVALKYQTNLITGDTP